MAAHTLKMDIDRALRSGMFTERDPGASGTLGFHNKGVVIFEIVTTGAETRALPAASGYPVGARLIVVFKTDGGDLTITGAESSVVLSDAGDVAEFIISRNSTSKLWRLVATSRDDDATSVSRTEELAIGDNWRTHDVLSDVLPATPGDPDLAITTGTYGTSAPVLTAGGETNPNDVDEFGRVAWRVPDDYSPGTNLTLNITTTEQTAATTATIDAEVVRRADPDSDKVATAAEDITGDTSVVHDFTVTGTAIVPGDILDIRLTVNMTEASGTPDYDIELVEIDYTALS